jgi:hypothetical protein
VGSNGAAFQVSACTCVFRVYIGCVQGSVLIGIELNGWTEKEDEPQNEHYWMVYCMGT